MNDTSTGRRSSVFASVFVWGYALIALLPLGMMVLNSFRTTADLYTEPLGLPWPPHLEAYVIAWTDVSFSTFFVNSVVVTLGSVFLTALVSLPAAYALSRWKFRGAAAIEALFIAGLMIPVLLTVLPVFQLVDGLGLLDSQIALILLYAAGGIPFSIFVLSAFFRQLPIELEEAAEIDGAGRLRTFFSVMMPLVAPAIATVIIFRFVPVWNEFLFPLVLLRSEEKYTLPVGLTRFFGEYSTDWAPLFAALVISTVPLLLVFVFATKYFIRGLTAGMGK